MTLHSVGNVTGPQLTNSVHDFSEGLTVNHENQIWFMNPTPIDNHGSIYIYRNIEIYCNGVQEQLI